MALAPIDIKVAGHWKSVDQVMIKIAGHWKPVGAIREKIAGHWKHIGTTDKRFITTWRTAADGDDVALPVSRYPTGNDMVIDWGDGSAVEHSTAQIVSHSYTKAGDYDIKISGTIGYWSFTHPNTLDKSQFIGIKNWGSVVKGSYNAFAGLPNFEFITAADQPDFSAFSFPYIFSDCVKLATLNISHWVFSGGTPCNFMFKGCKLANFDATWPGFKPHDAGQMFSAAAAFAGDISTWDVSAMSPDTYFMYVVPYPTAMYDKLLIAWGAQTVLTGKTIGFGSAKYTPGGAAEAGRDSLIAQGWTINDAGPV